MRHRSGAQFGAVLNDVARVGVPYRQSCVPMGVGTTVRERHDRQLAVVREALLCNGFASQGHRLHGGLRGRPGGAGGVDR